MDDEIKPKKKDISTTEASKQKPVMEGVVKRVKGAFSLRSPCLNMILQAHPYPRLLITSTLDSDGKEGIYKKDIFLFGSLKVTLKN